MKRIKFLASSRQIIALGIIASMLGTSPALANEPLSFKVKFIVKTVALYPLRAAKFIPQYGLLDGLYVARYSEVINMRLRGQGYESFKFFSWGD